MIRNTYRRPVFFIAACLIAGAAVTSQASAAGTWRFKGYTLDPTQEKLNDMHKIWPADEYRVSGTFQAQFSGHGTIELWHRQTSPDNKVFLEQGRCTIGTSSPMDTLVPRSVLHFTGEVGVTSNVSDSSAKCGAAINDLNDFISFTGAPNRSGSGSGDTPIPDGHPGATLDFHINAYMEGPGSLGETLHANYLWVEGPAPTPSSSNTPSAEPRQLSNNWNTGGCGLTAAARLDLGQAVRLDRIELWYLWQADESSVPFTLLRNGQSVEQGSLKRSGSDPYQGAWCVARGQIGSALPAGAYQVRVGRAGVCQNGASGGNGFIRAYGW